MARKSKITKGKFTAAYRKSQNVAELAEKLGIAAPTVYKFIVKYKLKNLNRERKQIPDKKIKEVMKRCNPLNKSAHRLGIAPTALRQRCYRLGITIKSNTKLDDKDLAFKFIKEYWVKDITAIAKKHKMEPRQVRHMMQKFSNDFCVKYKLPMIGKLRHFKIVNEIIHNKSLKKDIETLSEVTGMPATTVENYLNG